jgi:hypothetical protein
MIARKCSPVLSVSRRSSPEADVRGLLSPKGKLNAGPEVSPWPCRSSSRQTSALDQIEADLAAEGLENGDLVALFDDHVVWRRARALANVVAMQAETSPRASQGAVMSELTHEEALRLADTLAGQALKETEARCRILARFVEDCDRAGSRSADWSKALRDLHSLHGRRKALMRRRDLIQQALGCPVGESPANGALSPPPDRTVRRTQQQVQVRARRRS